MLRRIFNTGLIVLLIASTLVLIASRPVIAQAGAGISVQPSATVVSVGDHFSIDIQIDAGDQPVAAVDAFINFDTNYLSIDSIVPGTGFFDVILATGIDNENGKLNYSAGTFNMPPTGTFTIATVWFHAVAETPCTLLRFSTTLPRETAAALKGEYVTGTITGGTVTIKEAGIPPEVIWLPPLSTKTPYLAQCGSTVPIKFQLVDASNNPVNEASAIVTVYRDRDGLPVLSELADKTGHGYKINAKTKGWEPGDYTITISVAGLNLDAEWAMSILDKAQPKGKQK